MAQNRNPYLKIAQPVDLESIKKIVKTQKRQKYRRRIVAISILLLMIVGTYLLLSNQTYGKVLKVASYKGETADTNRYARFADGIVRYSRDGVIFLNQKNEEQWIQPTQMKNPIIDVNEKTFAVADSGGNTILVFTKAGVKGEVETTLPIEKISISNQGIVTAILKNENAPLITTYDATGNILVENQVTTNSTGYPIALDMSKDGMNLVVSYLNMVSGNVQSKVMFYDFGVKGQAQTDNLMGVEEQEGSIVPEVFFMGDRTMVAVSDRGFSIYEGLETPKLKKEISISQEIKSVFHTEKYIGFILLNIDKSGYEARLYNKSGKQLMNKSFTGDYSNVKMQGDEILMYEGSKCCIITQNGILRFQGDLQLDALELIPLVGGNRYLVVNANELRVVYLTK